MRVLLLNYEYPPLGGGAGVATAALAARLSDEGHDVDVVTSRAPHDSIEEPPALAGPAWEPRGGRAAAETSTGTLAVHRVASLRHGLHDAGLSGAAGYLLTALPVVRRLARERSYTVAHVFFSLPTGAILPFAGLRGVPLVVSLRGSDVPGYDPRAARLRVLHRALLPVTRWIWGRADRVVAVCDSLARLARRTKPDLCCEVIPNGVDLDLFRPDLARGAAGPGGPLRCIAVARLVDRKGLATLLRAFAQLPPERFRLEIVGSGPEEHSLRELAARLRLGGVRFAGALARPAVALRYRQADVFVLTPHHEAFGNVFAEALASGLPVVGSEVGGVPELIREGLNGFLVAPDDPLAVVQALQRLESDPALRARLGAHNRADAEARLSWKAVTQRYLDLYASLHAARAASRQEAA